MKQNKVDKDWGFTSPLLLRFKKQPIDGKWFDLDKPFSYIAKDGTAFIVPAGICTDFASIPRIFRVFIARVGSHGKAAVLHDWLCEYKVVPRKQADKLFLEAMVSLKVNIVRRRIMYMAVAAYTLFSRKK